MHRYTTISAREFTPHPPSTAFATGCSPHALGSSVSAQLWALKGHDIDAMKFYFEGVRLRTSDALKGLGIGDGDEVKVVVEDVDS